jgi:hypothetical protein
VRPVCIALCVVPQQQPGGFQVADAAVLCCAVLCCAGPEDDRKAKVAWRQEKAAEEKRLAQER